MSRGRTPADETPEVRPNRADRYGDDNVLIDAHEDDWAWRRRIRSNPATAKLYRAFIGVLGLVVTTVGVIAIPAPGPGWLIVFAGLAIWASEFEWAQRLNDFAKSKVRAWEAWLRPQAWWVKAGVALGTFLLVVVIFWLLFLLSGVPTWLPDGPRSMILKAPGL